MKIILNNINHINHFKFSIFNIFIYNYIISWLVAYKIYIQLSYFKECYHPTIEELNNHYYYTDSHKITRYTTGNEPICWFFEKGANVRSAYKVAPIFANLLIETKTLMIVRNPLKQLISYVTLDFENRGLNNTYNIDEFMYKFYQNKTSFLYIKKQIKYLLTNLTYINTSPNEINENLINSKIILNFFKNYLYEALVKCSLYIDGTLEIHMKQGRIEKAFGATTHAIPLLFYIYAYDESFGYNNWNQFRIIQYEWLYNQNNFFNGLSVIKCWLQTNIEIKNDAFNKCPQIFYNNKKYFDKIKIKIDQLSQIKVGHRTHNIMDEFHKNAFKEFYQPFKQLFLFILQKRPQLLLGEWIDWLD